MATHLEVAQSLSTKSVLQCATSKGFINGLSMVYQWFINGLSMVYQ
jgi:hypothetical protein